MKEFIRNVLIDTEYKIRGRKVAIEICFNGECWTPTIDDKAKEIVEKIHKQGGEVVIKFNYINDDFKSYVIVSAKAAGKNYLAYSGISCKIKNILPQEVISPISSSKNFIVSMVLNIANKSCIKSLRLARDEIELNEECAKKLVNILNDKFVECLLKQNVKVTSHQIDWRKFSSEKYKKLYNNIIFECFTGNNKKDLKMNDLIKLAEEENFDIVLCHHTSTLIDKLRKLNNNLIIIILRSDEPFFTEEELIKVFRSLGITMYPVIDYLIEKRYAEYCLKCSFKRFPIEIFPIEKVIKILGTPITSIGEESCPIISGATQYMQLLTFDQKFTSSLFEIEFLEFPRYNLIFNKNHILIDTLCNVLTNPQASHNEQEILKHTSSTIKRLDGFIREIIFERKSFERESINEIKNYKKEFLEILEPLARKLNVKLTEEDLPWD